MLGLVVATSRAVPVANAKISTKLSYFSSTNSTLLIASVDPLQSASYILFGKYFYVIFDVLGCILVLLLVIAVRRSAQCYSRHNWHLCFLTLETKWKIWLSKFNHFLTAHIVTNCLLKILSSY